ncbi:MAG: ribonuclease HI [Holosporales bacterium]|nr:ribonuclease HI [Holosporales bacterium]
MKDFIGSLKKGDSVDAYTDGACSGNPGPGGWGVILIHEGRKALLSGYDPDTTNNRMELMSVIRALQTIPSKAKITIFTDSSYVQNGITRWIRKWELTGWKSSSGSPVKNQDLWIELLEVSKEKEITWTLVKGHSGCIYNEDADTLARSAIITSYMKNP